MLVLIVITLGSFLASFVNAAFATGGSYVLLAASAAVLPLTAAIPLLSAFALSSQVARCHYFREHIRAPIVGASAIGSLIGVAIGARIFISMPEALISLLLGALLLILAWMPRVRARMPLRHPFFLVGLLHSFTSTLVGVGAFLQPAILQTGLDKRQITATLAACLLAMEIFKLAGYIAYGFDYLDYLPAVLLATLAGFAGTWAGARISGRISERTFRLVFRALITALALQLLYKGWSLR